MSKQYWTKCKEISLLNFTESQQVRKKNNTLFYGDQGLRTDLCRKYMVDLNIRIQLVSALVKFNTSVNVSRKF